MDEERSGVFGKRGGSDDRFDRRSERRSGRYLMFDGSDEDKDAYHSTKESKACLCWVLIVVINIVFHVL